jgi:hypothetical protein
MHNVSSPFLARAGSVPLWWKGRSQHEVLVNISLRFSMAQKPLKGSLWPRRVWTIIENQIGSGVSDRILETIAGRPPALLPGDLTSKSHLLVIAGSQLMRGTSEAPTLFRRDTRIVQCCSHKMGRYGSGRRHVAKHTIDRSTDVAGSKFVFVEDEAQPCSARAHFNALPKRSRGPVPTFPPSYTIDRDHRRLVARVKKAQAEFLKAISKLGE